MKWQRSHSSLPPNRRAAAGLWILVFLAFASPATATLKAVAVDPPAPATCDSVTITATGEIPNDCYEIVGAQIRGPEYLPCARPTPCPARFVVEITVREPNPAIERYCILVTAPYTRSFAVGKLGAGEYVVQASERVLPFAPDSTDSIVSESFASGTFTVRSDSTCSAFPGCFLLGLAPDRIGEEIPIDPRCTASAAPGGTACLALTLTNSRAVAGLQTTLQISGLVLPVTPDEFLRAISVDPMGRAAGFQVGWTVEGSRTKILLYSTSGNSIAPGDGPVARICYAVAPETPPQEFRVFETATLVSDPAGDSIPPCPTFAMIPPGIICVGLRACDVNGDGVSDVLDVIRLVRCALAGGADSASACPDSVAARSDCNGDGSVDVRDVVCCVRKIVAALGTSSGIGQVAARLQSSAEGSAIGFEGAPHWINDHECHVMVRIDAAEGWGGMQFSIDPGGAAVRIGGMAVDGARAPGKAMIESATDASGVAHAIVYGIAPGDRSAAPIGIDIILTRSAPGSGTLRLTDLKAGTATGEVAPISSFNPTMEVGAPAPAAPALLAARPNPTSGSTDIGFVLPADARVTLRLYDVAGRLVRTLVEGSMPAGAHRARWDGLDARGRAARSGIYFAKLQAGATIRSEQILLLR